MATAFGPKQPTYNTILALDRQIRDFPIPEEWRPICRGVPIPTELCLKRWTILAAKETNDFPWLSALLNLHRAYFAKALQEMPAWRLMKYLIGVWTDSSRVLSRLTLPWSQALSAAIVMCLIVTRAPMSNMAASALSELDRMYALFQDASSTARSAKNLLGSIQSLHKKAHDVLNQSRGPIEGLPSNAELDRWSGKTHLLTEVGAPDSGNPSSIPPCAKYTATVNEYWSDAQVDQMHPTLAHDMRGFVFREHTSEEFYDIPTSSLPQPTIPDLPIGDPMFFNPAEFHVHQPQSHHSPFLQNAPMLDATWQNFAEQLGF
ncbi:hypothetical protein H0H92_013212 [Tricholoma furcatifolium]|nr:hypothetical protein H0H92_013212 [Tricholoma furcatifolium]